MATQPDSARPTTWQIWYQAIRPRSLTATYVPIFLAGVIAWEAFRLDYFLLALVGTLMLQIAANLFNEYFDHVKGVEAAKSHGLGLILKQGFLTPQQIFMGAVLSLLVGCAIGLFFVWQTGFTILWIGIAAVLVVILYTAGPFALAYIGLGETAVFIFMGPMITFGAYFVMVEQADWLPIVGALPIGCLVAAILHANNLRDLDADRLGGKRTLAVRLGRQGAQAEYSMLVLGGHLVTVGLVLGGIIPWGTLLALLTLPEALRLNRIARTTIEGPPLHGVLVHTARLHALFGGLYVLGWGWSRLLS